MAIENAGRDVDWIHGPTSCLRPRKGQEKKVVVKQLGQREKDIGRKLTSMFLELDEFGWRRFAQKYI